MSDESEETTIATKLRARGAKVEGV